MAGTITAPAGTGGAPAEVTERSTREGLPDWLRDRLPAAPRVGRVVLWLAVLGAIATIHLVNIAGFPAFFDDEGTYVSQAWAVRTDGDLAPYTYWYDHPPLGWIQLAALDWLPRLFLPAGVPYLVGARVAMVGVTLVSAALIHRLACNLGLRDAFAWLAVLLWGLSPLVIVEGRQVFLDNLALAWLLAAFVLVTSPSRRLWFAIGAGVCFGVAVLSKETMLVAGPALLVVAWQQAYRPARRFAVVGLVTAAGLAGAVYALMAALRGELLPGPDHTSLWAGISFQLADREGSGFILDPGSGAFGILSGWLAADAVLLVGGTAAALGLLFVPRLQAITLPALIFGAVAFRPDGYLPFMYVIAILPFLALALAAVADLGWTAARRPAFSVPRYVAAGVLGVLLLGVGNSWLPSQLRLLTEDANAGRAEAMAYVEESLPRDSIVVVDNTWWNDLVRAGWSGDGFDGAVWFYKVDQDPAAREVIRSSADIDYLIWTTTMANDPNDAPVLADAYAESTTVATFGTGPSTVEIRKVES